MDKSDLVLKYKAWCKENSFPFIPAYEQKSRLLELVTWLDEWQKNWREADEGDRVP